MLICAGGTGGGVYPALTVLDALDLDHKSILWVGSRGGMEKELVLRRDIPYQSIPAAGVHGVSLAKLPGNLFTLLKGFISSIRILKDFQPDVLFFTGGFVAVPMAIAALQRPSVLYVPDIEPGLALKALARFADRIALTTEDSKMFFPNKSKLDVTGYPVRSTLKTWTREKALDYFSFKATLPTLTVAGGSKGARSINMALLKILPDLLSEMQVIHLTGLLDWETVDENTKTLPPILAKRYQAFPYLHEMGAALAAADLIVSRAGASILGEYPQFGCPAILIPYPHAWRYQHINAEYLASCGAAEILQDEKLDHDLHNRIKHLMSDSQTLKKMRRAMSTLATPDADKHIADIILKMANPINGGKRA